MGESRRRAQEIKELKQKPVERTRRRLIQFSFGNFNVNHFNNRSDRDKAFFAGCNHANVESVPATLVHPVNVKIRSYAWHEQPARPSRQLTQITFVTGRKLTDEEFMIHASAMEQINPKGFRQPSVKEKNYTSTSMLEQLSIALGDAKTRIAPERSKRGLKKVEANQQMKALILLERLIEDNQDRVKQAKANPKLVKWFFGKVMAGVNGDIDPAWLETTVAEKVKSGGIAPKYLTRAARDRRRDTTIGDLILAARPELAEAA